MAKIDVDFTQVKKLIKDVKFGNILKSIEGIDIALGEQLNKQIDDILGKPSKELEKVKGAGNNAVVGLWISMWEALWIVVEPLLPSMYHFFGQLDAVRQISTQQAFLEERPTPLDVGAVIQYLHFYPEESEEVLENLKLQGFSDDRIRQLILAGRSTLSEADIEGLRHRGEITREKAIEKLGHLGYEATEAASKMGVWDTLLDAGTIRSLYLRGHIDDSEAHSKLERLGFTKLDVDKLKELFWFIPPAQDLITMAVREVFTPAVAERFGQYEDFPEAFAEHAQKLGISREWAERYWAAHWDLPSMQMGFEMLHRGVIGQEDLDMLLKAKDVMPFWRDKLTAISYNPLTRVDVRRMHAIGVLDREGVKRSYLDVGYNNDNAELMTGFTVAYNSRRERDLSKSEIVSSYINRLIGRDDTLSMLLDMGYDEQESALVLMLAEIKQFNKLKARRIKAVKNKYLKGVIDFNQVGVELQGLNLTGGEIEVVLEEIEISKTEKAEELSLKDLKAAFKKRIILEPKFRVYLKEKGYGIAEVDILVKLVKLGG